MARSSRKYLFSQPARIGLPFTTTLALFGLSHVQVDDAEPTPVLRSMPLAHTALIFVKTRLELPVQAAFHTPVTADTGAMVAALTASTQQGQAHKSRI